ncbi:MAG TPA: nitrile hydratase subunit beta [Gemmataceae bacterium]|nr:nitrile hydratase subunit beta [Gemmataceae bacterium]
MNGGHDLGGMHGLGPINAEPEDAESVFHADWEKRVFGLVRTIGALGRWTSDASRHARERQHPADYLRHSYYENWLVGLEKLLLETGLVTLEELATGKSKELASAEIRSRLLKAEDVAAVLPRGSSAAMPTDTTPRFQPGDRVRAINRHPLGHTREPRYVRGRVGVIHEYHGAHVFPDLSAEGVKVGRHLYGVRFEAAELWGENANDNSAVYVDLWEDYLEPA